MPRHFDNSEHGAAESIAPRAGCSRRAFFGRLGALAAGTTAVAWLPQSAAAEFSRPRILAQGAELTAHLARRREAAFKMRLMSANWVRQTELAVQPGALDEVTHPSGIANYTKGLPHDDQGVVDGAAYQALLSAAKSGKPSDFDRIPIAGTMKLVSPQGSFAFGMSGADSWSHLMRACPTLDSAEAAGELVELYWHALTRDIPFSAFESDSTIARAAADMSRLSDFRGPKSPGGSVTPKTIFRGNFPGDLAGPYVSQFLLKDVIAGAAVVPQKFRFPTAGSDYVTNYETWLALQRGTVLSPAPVLDEQPRHIHSQRDLAEWVHRDWPAQAFVNAALILEAFGPDFKSRALPYAGSANQAGFVTFGIVDVMAALNEVAAEVLRAAWYSKWCVHRRLRPDAMAGRAHLALTGGSGGPFHSDLLNSEALAETLGDFGSYFLSMSYPEGSPTHPSYPSGHAANAGACITVLKAFYREDAEIPGPVVATEDGSTLVPYAGEALTVGGELNKLASNLATGRNMAGIHYRSDAVEGIRLGEAVAIAFLRNRRPCYSESFEGFRLTKLDGTPITI